MLLSVYAGGRGNAKANVPRPAQSALSELYREFILSASSIVCFAYHGPCGPAFSLAVQSECGKADGPVRPYFG